MTPRVLSCSPEVLELVVKLGRERDELALLAVRTLYELLRVRTYAKTEHTREVVDYILAHTELASIVGVRDRATAALADLVATLERVPLGRGGDA
jgi:hypothetical protein